jgi:transcriptional regulator with XRE-family HTH domain
MDFTLVVRHRLEELGFDQRDLATAAQVTESYVSQLLTRKKPPPATDRTGIYEKMEQFLRLPAGELAKLADLQRREEWKKKLADPPAPLFQEVRELVVRKCNPNKRSEILAIFEKQPFGELERLVTQKLLDVVKKLVKRELQDDQHWLALLVGGSSRSPEEIRVSILEFLDTDVFHVSVENCVSFLDPLIESWDIDFVTFGLAINLNREIGQPNPLRFEFREQEADFDEVPGFREFLENKSLSGDATKEEIDFLKMLRVREKRPNALFYYRELQNLRDPLHFCALSVGRKMEHQT